MEDCLICGGTGEVRVGEFDDIRVEKCICLSEESDESNSLEE
jgi:hypothetical protein